MNNHYKDLSLEKIKEILGELYFKDGKEVLEEIKDYVPTPEEQITIDALKSKILTGYLYTIINPCEGVTNTRKTNLITGYGGVMMYIDNCVKGGIPAEDIALAIYVQTDNHGQQCIANLSVTKKKK